eukprot:4112603-Prymnesium_polylepis.1
MQRRPALCRREDALRVHLVERVPRRKATINDCHMLIAGVQERRSGLPGVAAIADAYTFNETQRLIRRRPCRWHVARRLPQLVSSAWCWRRRRRRARP